MAEPIQLYICFAEENKNALSRLEQQLRILMLAGTVQPWHSGELTPGDYRAQQIVTHLDQAQIIIVLVSANLFGEYYNSPEMQRAFQLYKEHKVHLIPVVVGPCDWQEDQTLGGLEPLPRGGKPAGLDDGAWLNVAKEINKIARQIQLEQVQKELALAAKSSNPRTRSRKAAGAKPQPLSGAVVMSTAATSRRSTKRPQRSTPPPVPTQPTLPERTLPVFEEPESVSAEARATTPAYRQDYDQTQNNIHQIVLAILIWEPSQSTYDLIANERRAIYHALLDKQHQCTLGSALPIPEGQSLQDCEITQAQKSDLTVLLVEPQISPISDLREFYFTYNDKFIRKILCYYPETLKTTSEKWEFDKILFARNRLSYYEEAEITNCQVSTKVLSYVDAMCVGEYRDQLKSRRSGR